MTKPFNKPTLLVTIVAVLVAGTLIAVSQLASCSKVAKLPTSQAPTPSPPTGPPTQSPEQPRKGSPDAPVTIIEFAEFYCPFCARYLWETFPKIDEEYIQRGLVRYSFLNLIVHGKEAQLAAQAGECAHAQGRFWEFHDRLFVVIFQERQAYLNEEELKGVAKELGLDEGAFVSCLNSDQALKAVEKDREELKRLLAQLPEGERPKQIGTPLFFINGRPLMGAWPFEKFREIIEEELGKQSK